MCSNFSKAVYMTKDLGRAFRNYDLSIALKCFSILRVCFKFRKWC